MYLLDWGISRINGGDVKVGNRDYQVIVSERR